MTYDAFKAFVWSFGVIVLNFPLGNERLNNILNTTFGKDLNMAYMGHHHGSHGGHHGKNKWGSHGHKNHGSHGRRVI
jgi:hypothetical protein